MQTPDLSLKSDPACIAFRTFSSSRFLGFARRLGAGGAGTLPSLGLGVSMRTLPAIPALLLLIACGDNHSQTVPSYNPNVPVTNPTLVDCLAAIHLNRTPQVRQDLEHELNNSTLLQLVPGDGIRSSKKSPSGVLLQIVVLRDKKGALWIPLFTDWKAIQVWKSAPIEEGMSLGWADPLKIPWAATNFDQTVINNWKSSPIEQMNTEVWAPKPLWQFILKIPVAGIILNPGSDSFHLSHDEVINLLKKL